MNLRCVFHVRSASPTEVSSRERAPSVVDAKASPPEPPRGRSFETWSRARGWASED
jgi:hypothetical protein